jgi:polyhydroxybutyrate depolymerase
MAGWAKQDGCGAQAATGAFSQHVKTETWSGCRGGALVQLYVIDGGGHTWPGASVEVPALGATTREVSATDQIWQFFVAHPKEAPSH